MLRVWQHSANRSAIDRAKLDRAEMNGEVVKGEFPTRVSSWLKMSSDQLNKVTTHETLSRALGGTSQNVLPMTPKDKD